MTLQGYADMLKSKITKETHDVTYYTDVTQGFREHEGTSHISVLSPYGDAVSVTSTVNYGYGTGGFPCIDDY